MKFRSWFSLRFDLVEAAMMLALVLLIAWVVADRRIGAARTAIDLAAAGLDDLETLEHQYGPGHASRFAEEWIIRDFFHDKRGGVFVDVGANDYRVDNNTYYLETSLGWSGVAIDAQREFADGYRQHRPATKFFSLFVSDVSDSTADLYIPTDHPLNATSDRSALTPGDRIEARPVVTVTLNDLLRRLGIERVDFVSMDIELAEPKALAGFDVERLRPALVCVEADRAVRQSILDYFQGHRYVVVGRYLRADAVNLYFMPAG